MSLKTNITYRECRICNRKNPLAPWFQGNGVRAFQCGRCGALALFNDTDQRLTYYPRHTVEVSYHDIGLEPSS